jgi:hypothetical protein
MNAERGPGSRRGLDARPNAGAPRRPSVRRPPRPPRRRSRGWVWVVLVLAAAAGGAWWLLGRGPADDQGLAFGPLDDMEAAGDVVAGDRAVMLVFPEWDASGYVTEQRQISSRDRAGEDLLGIMQVLCDGPRVSGAVSALPQGTRALSAFVDRQAGSVVVDFSLELVTRHPGGSAAEAATLTSILRTVALNFPDTRSCVILVDGAQVETLAGHLDMIRPFDPRRWL